MANLITIGRLILLFIVIWLIYEANVQVITACMFLVIIVFASDGLDGWVARKRGSASPSGAVFDIAGDRIAENVLWIIFADLNKLPIWVPLLVITRGFLVDGLRSLSYAEGMTAFGEQNMMRSALTQWLTAGRFMRGLFGWSKAAGFVYLTGLVGYEDPDSNGTALGGLYDLDWYNWLGWSLVWLSVVLTVVRGLPVLYDSIGFLRDRKEHRPDSTA